MEMMTFPCTLFYFLELKILPVPEASVRANLHYHPRDLALPSLGSWTLTEWPCLVRRHRWRLSVNLVNGTRVPTVRCVLHLILASLLLVNNCSSLPSLDLPPPPSTLPPHHGPFQGQLILGIIRNHVSPCEEGPALPARTGWLWKQVKMTLNMATESSVIYLHASRPLGYKIRLVSS